MWDAYNLRMKTLLKMMSVAFMAIVFTACSSNNPESVAVDFTEAVYTGHLEKAKSYCTERGEKTMAMLSKMLESRIDMMKDTDPEVKVIECEVSEDGESAKVKVEVSKFLDGNDGEISDKPKNETVRLKKVDGDWKVEFSK